uniref:Uncharacterized protein n=1 Tax=Solanum tuberosum TaxID=4113 RepID=M1DHX1_SOLTU
MLSRLKKKRRAMVLFKSSILHYIWASSIKDITPQRAYVRRNANENVEREALGSSQEAPQVLADLLAEQVMNGEF